MAFLHVDRFAGHVTALLRTRDRRGTGNAGCSAFATEQGTDVIWSYFDNGATSSESVFAVSALARPIYRDIGATIPTWARPFRARRAATAATRGSSVG